MPEISNKKRKFINKNFKHLSIEELARKTGIKPHVIRSLIDEYSAHIPGEDQCVPSKPITNNAPNVKIKILFFSALLLCCFLNTYQRNGIWKEETTLWSDGVLKSALKARPHNNLGLAYGKKGMLDKAILECKKAIVIDPNFSEAHSNLGLAYGEKGMLDKAILECKKALALYPNYADARNNLGYAYVKKGMLVEAISEYKKALTINPNFSKVYSNLGIVYYNKGNYQLAITHFDKAIELGYNVNPEFLELLKPHR